MKTQLIQMTSSTKQSRQKPDKTIMTMYGKIGRYFQRFFKTQKGFKKTFSAIKQHTSLAEIQSSSVQFEPVPEHCAKPVFLFS
jgi:hypothetical protein